MPPETAPPRKHITTACLACRESKVKCDGATPTCRNCQRKSKKVCRYQYGDDKRKISLRAATELFSARTDQLCQFIHDHGLEPPPFMSQEDETAINRVLDTLQIPRRVHAKATSASASASQGGTGVARDDDGSGRRDVGDSLSKRGGATTIARNSLEEDREPDSGQWGISLPTAQSLDQIYERVHDSAKENAEVGSSDQVRADVEAPSLQCQRSKSGSGPGRAQANRPDDSDSGDDDDDEEDAENEVIRQLSNRMGTLKIAGDGHLRFYGPTSNLNLVDVSSSQQRERPDARTVRHDGQDLLNHLRIGQSVDLALENHLLELYFTWQNPSAYVVDKEMYMSSRDKWRKELDDTPYYSEVLTNAMCAIGSAFEARYHPTFITFPKSLAEFFADRAKALLEIELDSPCVATVQALVILSAHEGASNRDPRGWLCSGMSMRLAFDLGLHVDMTPYVERGDMSPVEADVRRAVFWGSYVADQSWGFYLGRPFRINAGDITVSKLASGLHAENEAPWYPYGLGVQSDILRNGLRSPNELISRQFAILWEMISPVGHILYGCSDISRHELQRITFKVTEGLFAWKENLPSILQVDLDDTNAPKVPHLLMLHLQFHQINIFLHRPWVSRYYIQPRSPRQGPGYLHARRMCIESATAIARLLQLYERHYTFRRLNSQAVAMIFTAALMLLFVTTSPKPLTPTHSTAGNEHAASTKSGTPVTSNSNADMVAYLNLCFRALDELGQSFENAKRTRDFLVSLQRRWQSLRRRSGPKRQMSSVPLQSQPKPTHQTLDSQQTAQQAGPSQSHKRSKLATAAHPTQHPSPSLSHTTPNQTYANANRLLYQQHVPHIQPSSFQSESTFPLVYDITTNPQNRLLIPSQQGELDWIRDSDFQLLSGNFGDMFPQSTNASANVMGAAYPDDDGMINSSVMGGGGGGGGDGLSNLEVWWEAGENHSTSSMMFGESADQ